MDFLLFEALNRGRTPAKKYLGIRTVMDTGHPITFGAAAARNLVRFVDSFPFVGLPLLLFHPQHKRLGDLVAGTIVVREQAAHLKLGAPAAPAPDAGSRVEAGAPELSDQEYALLGRLLERLDDLEADQRARLVGDVARRFGSRFPHRAADDETFLVTLYTAERDKRQGRFATRATAGVGRTAMAAERFVARKQAAWEAFHHAAASVERSGLASMGPGEIPGFAARYREVIADLARACATGSTWCGLSVARSGLVLIYDEEQSMDELAHIFLRLGAPYDKKIEFVTTRPPAVMEEDDPDAALASKGGGDHTPEPVTDLRVVTTSDAAAGHGRHLQKCTAVESGIVQGSGHD